MKLVQEICENCHGFGEVTYYKTDEVNDNTGFCIAHQVTEKCDRCRGSGYVEEYVMFTVKEAQAILKHCGLDAEN